MLKTGKQYVESLRDGRVVYIGDEVVEDVTTHPAFEKVIKTYSTLYDLKRSPEMLDIMSFEENGERYSMHYLQPRSQQDLVRRSTAHRVITDWSCGVLGRSLDATGSNLTGMTLTPEVFDKKDHGFKQNMLDLYEHSKKNDNFLTYAIVPPLAARNPEYYAKAGVPSPTLRVTSEDDEGVVINGMKLLATSSAVANEVIVGNILPLAPDQKAESISCIIPFNLSGLSLWARKPFAEHAHSEFEGPLTYRFDESDCMLIFKDVKVPWEKVIVHNDPELSRDIFVKTGSHVLSNHQSNCRFHSKLKFLVGTASLVTQHTGARAVPAVRELLGRLAAMEVHFGALLEAQLYKYEQLNENYCMYGRRYMYAGLLWAAENHHTLLDTVRELMGGGVYQFPATVDVLRNPALRNDFETYWATDKHSAIERMKLFKLAWDLVGSDHASRLQSYEKFFVGPQFAVRNYNYINAPWEEYDAVVQKFMDQYDVPGM